MLLNDTLPLDDMFYRTEGDGVLFCDGVGQFAVAILPDWTDKSALRKALKEEHYGDDLAGVYLAPTAASTALTIVLRRPPTVFSQWEAIRKTIRDLMTMDAKLRGITLRGGDQFGLEWYLSLRRPGAVPHLS